MVRRLAALMLPLVMVFTVHWGASHSHAAMARAVPAAQKASQAEQSQVERVSGAGRPDACGTEAAAGPGDPTARVHPRETHAPAFARPPHTRRTAPVDRAAPAGPASDADDTPAGTAPAGMRPGHLGARAGGASRPAAGLLQVFRC